MDYVGYLAIAGIVGFVGWLIWLGYATSEVKDEVEKIKAELPTPSDLKKLKKAELVSLAEEHSIMVDMKSTKARIIEEINASR